MRMGRNSTRLSLEVAAHSNTTFCSDKRAVCCDKYSKFAATNVQFVSTILRLSWQKQICWDKRIFGAPSRPATIVATNNYLLMSFQLCRIRSEDELTNSKLLVRLINADQNNSTPRHIHYKSSHWREWKWEERGEGVETDRQTDEDRENSKIEFFKDCNLGSCRPV